MSVKIDIHADDFGESVHASRDILECLKDGKLNSISVLANMSCFSECVQLYREVQGEFPWQPGISVHVNLMEGSCLADPKELPDEVLEEQGWKASYIRDAKEPFFVFLKKTSLYKTYRPVNFVKNILLNYCSALLQKRFRKAGMEPMYLWGLIMSGHMDEERIRQLLPDMEKKAEHNGRILEILFHPGQVLREEISDEFSQEDAIAFHVSPDRSVEKQAVYALDLAQRARKQ